METQEKLTVLKNYCLNLGVRVVNLQKDILTNYNESVLSRRLIESGTLSGEFVVEAIHSQTQTEFNHYIYKTALTLDKTLYWLELLHATGYMENEKLASFHQDIQRVQKLIDEIKKAL